MLPGPRRTVSTPAPQPASSWPDIDDDDGWQDMPVVRTEANPLGLDDDDQKRYHYRHSAYHDPDLSPALGGPSSSNATGTHLEVDADTLITDSWREKVQQDESEYTRLRLEEDEESEEVHMRTRYLFDEDKAMTPLSQMQATKELLTEGQRIAYVGLCQLVARRMVRDAGRGWEGVKSKGLKGKKKDPAVVESASVWMIKIMARLYQHMEVSRDEQRMIESLGEHGVDPTDLVPALMTTHTVKNPEFDPMAKKKADIEAKKIPEEDEEDLNDPPPAYQQTATEHPTSLDNAQVDPASVPLPPPSPLSPSSQSTSAIPSREVPVRPFGEDDHTSNASSSGPSPSRPSQVRYPYQDVYMDDGDDGDIGQSLSARPASVTSAQGAEILQQEKLKATETAEGKHRDDHDADPDKTPTKQPQHLGEEAELVETAAMPSLPGVSTSLSNTDETVTLDIRWTVLCDLFLVLIADSVYDSRSRAFLEHIAVALGFGWLDAVRFENRVTNALDIEEAIEKTEQKDVIEGRRKAALKKRYAMMGLAAVGGGLVIGLSAGLLAPVIGAGIGGVLGTIGITGTTSFLAGAGGAAIITTGGVVTGANIAGRGMSRRTREVRLFEFKPLHNNKRVACYITMGGFMASKVDDVRLPFSVLDPVVGDVLSVLWEPEMMAEMGGALKILTSEVLTQVGQTVLQATVMAALMSALQWPIILTKLGYLIDNPWSNALDRSRAAGLVLADTILNRHAGIRPVSLIGFSLGARAIFYALVELAKHQAFGLVQDVFLFGTTVTANRQTWLDVRSVVAGRLVNGFASNDWMLGYLFRATSGGINTVAGLRPVETIPGLENVEVTDVITGHMSYRSCMPQLLAKVGFPVTADYFDEPDDPETDMSVQERTVINEEEELAKADTNKLLGIFPRSGKKSAPGSGTATPTGRRRSTEKSSPQLGNSDDDELPPREEESNGDIGMATSADAGASKDSLVLQEEEVIKAIPKTAGFDFQAISRALGKTIDVDALKEPSPRHPGSFSPMQSPQILDRSGSAPPPISIEPPREQPTSNTWTTDVETGMRSLSFSSSSPDTPPEGLAASPGYAAVQPPISDVSPWDRPSSAPPNGFASDTSPPLASSSSGNKSIFNFGFNAWSSQAPAVANAAPTTGNIPPLRAAPPARPHPAELMMANPFAMNGDGDPNGPTLPDKKDSVLDGWGKSSADEQWATKNPW